MKKYDKKVVVIGSGVAGINAVTELVDNGYPGELITVIDKGQNPYDRKPEEVMCGFAGAGAWSDGKLTYHTAIGGQLSKYCGEFKAYELMDKVISNFKRFHPNPEVIMKSDPQEEPEFIKPYFNLRLFPVYHIGSDYLHQIAINWYEYLVSKGVNFYWETELKTIDFESNHIYIPLKLEGGEIYDEPFNYDQLLVATGKSGIDFTSGISKQYSLPTEPKSVQIGVRFESPQKYFQKLIDVSYDFKLYQKFDNVSLRTFCTNNNAAYVAVEETYGDITYNGHALKDPTKTNNMTNFGILMEIKGIENPFEWSREVVKKCQHIRSSFSETEWRMIDEKIGTYFSPSRLPSLTSEDKPIACYSVGDGKAALENALGEYAQYIMNFIDDMNKIFKFHLDWGVYIPEVKYLSPEPLVNYNDLSLTEYPNVHFVGDALSARGITVSGAQGIYAVEKLIKNERN